MKEGMIEGVELGSDGSYEGNETMGGDGELRDKGMEEGSGL